MGTYARDKPCARCHNAPRSKSSSYCKACNVLNYQDRCRNNPESVARARAKYNASEKGRAARKRYQESAKGKKTITEYRESEGYKEHKRKYERSAKGKKKRRNWEQRQREIQRRRLIANLPVAVVKPYVERVLREFGIPADSLARGLPSVKGEKMDDVQDQGHREMARALGVGEDTIRNVLRGRNKSVSLSFCDKLCAFADFSLEELTDRAEEWAFLTGDSWPMGYRIEPQPSLNSTE